MLTIFASTKPFCGPPAVHQRNALRSWFRLPGDVEILIFADPEGELDSLLREGRGRRLSIPAQTETGAPTVDALWEAAVREARHDWLAYVNADIILLSDFLPAVAKAREQLDRFLLVGRRHEMDLPDALGFGADWESRLRERLANSGRLSAPPGLTDYLVFPRDLWGKIPPFGLGRTQWDAWLIQEARRRRVPVVDATGTLTAVHPEHRFHFSSVERLRQWRKECLENRRLAGKGATFSLYDATHRLTPEGLRAARGPHHLVRRLEYSPLCGALIRPLFSALRRIRSFARADRRKSVVEQILDGLPPGGVIGIAGDFSQDRKGSYGRDLALALGRGGHPVVLYDPQGSGIGIHGTSLLAVPQLQDFLTAVDVVVWAGGEGGAELRSQGRPVVELNGFPGEALEELHRQALAGG